MQARKAMPKLEKIKDMHTMIMAQNAHHVKKEGFPTAAWERQNKALLRKTNQTEIRN
tara:strand:+ start:296 stop:466 length:171 start_codon:yes stop_codon:yes gene_type:complete